MFYKNQLSRGFSTASHKNKTIFSSLASESFKNFYTSLNRVPYKVGYIPAGYEHRPDLISNLFYGTPTKDWFICYFNNIKDPFNELNVGDRILIPDTTYDI